MSATLALSARLAGARLRDPRGTGGQEGEERREGGEERGEGMEGSMPTRGSPGPDADGSVVRDDAKDDRPPGFLCGIDWNDAEHTGNCKRLRVADSALRSGQH